MAGKRAEPLYLLDLLNTDVVIFDGASNVQLGGEILKIFQLCVDLNTLYIYSTMIFPKAVL